MRLGFHYHVPAIKKGDTIWMPAYFGLFVDSVATHCESLVCFLHSPVGPELAQMDYAIRAPHVRLVDLGPHSRVPIRALRAWPHMAAVHTWQQDLDALLIRAPTPLLPFFAQRWQKPVALLLVSDERAGIDNLPQPPWRKTLIRWWTAWNHAQQMRLAQRSLVFVNSRLLFEQFRSQIPHLIETQTTTLSETDFYLRADTCQTTPYRLLYTGRITRSKGLFEIVTAVAALVKEGFDVVLDLVGMVDPSDPVLDSLVTLAQEQGIGGRITYHGYKTAGPALLAYYRQADVYVIASQSSNEGFPRTIWEAMASGLPVVATQVGSIPAFAGSAAALVPPRDVDALTRAIREVLTQPLRRRTLIQEGFALARNNTLEKRAQELSTQLLAWVAASQAK